MIATASKYVNARIGRPSVNAPNPKYLIPGDKVNIRSRVIGDPVNGNYTWYLTEENELFSAEGFPVTEEMRAIPFYAHQDNRPQLLIDLNISALWENTSMGQKINIGIIDNGVAHHTALKGKVTHLNAHPTNLDPNNHGTTMACIISAFDETNGKIGIAPMVENIFSYYIDSGTGYFSGEPNDILMALKQMDTKNVHIINMSIATQKSNFFPVNAGGNETEIPKQIDSLVKKGVIIVCSTGNNNTIREKDVFPAGYDNVFSVTGYGVDGNLNFSSKCWDGVRICLPVSHFFKSNDPQYGHSNGTSGASALFSGIMVCAYYKIKEPKSDTLKKNISNFPTVSYRSPSIYIPKFDTNIFLKSLKPIL